MLHVELARSQTQPRGLRPEKALNAIKKSRDFLVRDYRKCIYTAIRALAVVHAAASHQHAARLRTERSPFVVVSKSKTSVTARASAQDIELIKNCNYRVNLEARIISAVM